MARKNANLLGIDERKRKFIEYYVDPASPTVGNAKGSAERAGYTTSYARTITVRDVSWINDMVTSMIGKPTDKRNLLSKAKKVLNKSLDSDDEKLAQDTAKFILSTDPEFSSKQESKIEVPTPIFGGLSKGAVDEVQEDNDD